MDPSFPTRPFTAADAKEAGISRKALRTAIKNGQVKILLYGVYAPADLADTFELRVMAIALVLPSHQVVCDRTAAWIHGIDTFTYGELGGTRAVETCARRGKAATTRLGIDGRTRDLTHGDVMTAHGVQVTTPLRTALDLGCLLHRRDAMAALDAFCRIHEITKTDLLSASRRYRRRRGVVQLRELIQYVEPRAESHRESWTRLEIIDAGLPVPELQHWIVIDGVPTYRLDLAYPHLRIAVEYDGFDAHDRDPAQKKHDADRRAWLRTNGWTVIVVKVGDFTGARLEAWIRELRNALSATPYSNKREMERGSRSRVR